MAKASGDERSPASEDAAEHDALVDSAEMPFMAHVVELRQRILRGLLAVFVLFLPIYFFANQLYEFVAAPLMAHLPNGGNMIATQVASPFLTPFKLAVYAAIFLGMPVLLHQAWSFIAPGLYRNEKRLAIPLFISSVFLFYAGIAFARYVLFGVVFQFFISVAPDGIQVAPDISSFLSFALTIFLAFGLAFEIPIAVYLCISAGLVEPESLSRKRPYVVVGCFVVAMLLTPPDPFTQSMLAIPMWALFEVGIIAGKIARKRQQQETGEKPAG